MNKDGLNSPLKPGSATTIVPWHAGFLLLVGLLGSFKMVNADIWWHLRTGALILQTGSVPRTDWYTYTNPDSVWVDLHWLFQVAAWAVYATAGVAALIVAKCLVGMVAFTACLSIRKKSWDPSLDILCWLIPVFLFSGRFLVRPEVLSICFLAATLFVLHYSSRTGWVLWLLPAIQLVWVNTQSLFVLQWVVLSCFCLDAAARGYRQRRSVLPVPRWRFVTVIGATALATLCNPYGIRGALFPLVVFGKLRGPDREFFHAFAPELRGPLDLVHEFGVGRVILQPSSLLLIGLVTAAIVVTALRWKRGDWEIFRTLLLLGFSYLAIKMTRNAALCAIIAGYVLRWNLGVLREGDAGSRVHHRPGMMQYGVGAILVASILLVGSGGYHGRMRVLPPREFGFGQSDWYPHAAARQLSQPGMPDHVYAHHLGVAAVCIMHASPARKIYVDARLETNSRETLAAYHEIIEGLAMQQEGSMRALAGSSDPYEWPAIVIANHELVSRPGLLGFIAGHRDWVCVYSESPAQFDLSSTRGRLVGGASIFVSRQRQKEFGLSLADPRWLFVVARNRTQGM